MDDAANSFAGSGSLLDVSSVPAGEAVDKEVTAGRNLVSIDTGRQRSRTTDSEPKSGPPKLDEWQDFLSRVVLGLATDAYIDWVFRGIDEDALTEREVSRLQMREEERDRIAKPIAELANKLKFTRKHGRTIIAASGSAESAWYMAMWFNRVNRVARKHRPERPTQGKVSHERTGPSSPAENNGTGGQHGNYTIFQPGTG